MNLFKYKYLSVIFLYFILSFFSSKNKLSEEDAEHSEKGHEHEEEQHDEDHDEHGHHEGEEQHNEDHGEHGHEKEGLDDHGSSEFGPDKAITRVEKSGKRFELNEKAEKLLKIATVEIKAQGKNFIVPISAIVSFRDEYGVYVKRGKAYQLLETKKLVKNFQQVTIELEAAGSSEFIVTQGVGLLRVSHLQASGQGGEGHVH